MDLTYWITMAIIIALSLGESTITTGLAVALALIGPIGAYITGEDNALTPGLPRLIRRSRAAAATTLIAVLALAAVGAGAASLDSRRHVPELILGAGIVMLSWMWAIKLIHVRRKRNSAD